MKTPSEWTANTLIYPKLTVSNPYNFDRAVYSDSPSAQLSLCWQPADDSADVQERGEITSSSYTAVIYDDVEIKHGDMAVIDGLGCFTVSAIKKYITHRLVAVRSTNRSVQDV